MRALSSARCTGIRLHILRTKIGNQSTSARRALALLISTQVDDRTSNRSTCQNDLLQRQFLWRLILKLSKEVFEGLEVHIKIAFDVIFSRGLLAYKTTIKRLSV